MKNAEKIMTALKKAFTGHSVEMMYIAKGCFYRIFIDYVYVGDFWGEFFEDDIDSDNPEIEIKIKAHVNDIKDFLYECEGSGGVAVVMKEVERGFEEWQEGSQPNS